MKEITDYIRRSESTALEWHYNHGMPMKKLNGQWESDTEAIDLWRLKLMTGEDKSPEDVQKPRDQTQKVVKKTPKKKHVKQKKGQSVGVLSPSKA